LSLEEEIEGDWKGQKTSSEFRGYRIKIVRNDGYSTQLEQKKKTIRSVPRKLEKLLKKKVTDHHQLPR
jgi:hypothetical protein